MNSLIISIATFMLIGMPISATATEKSNAPSALVIKVEGTGSGFVKRKSRIETPLAVQLKMGEGDTLVTDAATTAEISLNDGTIVRIGRNSSYKITEISKNEGFTTWAFSLLKGSIRALVEKSPKKDFVKFRTNTPVGTMGVRGTEFVVKFDETTQKMSVYTIEGIVFAGDLKCEEKKNCATLKAGNSMAISKDGTRKESAKFDPLELIGNKDGKPEIAELFADSKMVEKMSSGSLQAKDISAMLKEASNTMQATQDQMLERTAAVREAMHKAMKDGTYATKIKVAERFEDRVKGSDKAPKVREEERSSGVLESKKFAFGDAVLKEFQANEKKTKIDLDKLKATDIDSIVDRARKEMRETKSAAGDLAKNAALTSEQLAKQAQINQLLVEAESLSSTIQSQAVDTNTVTTTKTSTSTSGGQCFKNIQQCSTVNVPVDPSCNPSTGAFCLMQPKTSCSQIQTNQPVPCNNVNSVNSQNMNQMDDDDDDDDDGFFSRLF